MNASPRRAVLDTVVLLQALISGRGPAAACIEHLRSGRFVLLLSDDTRAEAAEVPLWPQLRARYAHLTPERVDAFIREIESFAVFIRRPPHAFELTRDPKDEPFIDLAVAGGATYLVTWNERHLNYLMQKDTPEGVDFCTRFPELRICTAPQLLQALAAGGSATVP